MVIEAELERLIKFLDFCYEVYSPFGYLVGREDLLGEASRYTRLSRATETHPPAGRW